ncbi:hypothetical protein EVAR_35304_1 [Eumeta japonica]|uniref:Uncharacterized protein n=1 Tax=Eumeta variegata TaxID=151549 RepID=A0A4C1XLM9_EUMVA|nr:hypothetical protein EVAR_35304_1 [Eumeta japonica]
MKRVRVIVALSLSFNLSFTKYLIPTQEVGNAPVTPSRLRVSMGDDGHSISGGLQARLQLKRAERRAVLTKSTITMSFGPRAPPGAGSRPARLREHAAPARARLGAALLTSRECGTSVLESRA